jgi:hypothetical protein
VKASSTVLNGGDEETYHRATRLVPTHRARGHAAPATDEEERLKSRRGPCPPVASPRCPIRQRLVSVRGFQREVAVWTCEQQRRETRVQRQARDSHPVADGPWCTGTAPATDADADTTARPHAAHNQRGVYESLWARPMPHSNAS